MKSVNKGQIHVSMNVVTANGNTTFGVRFGSHDKRWLKLNNGYLRNNGDGAEKQINVAEI